MGGIAIKLLVMNGPNINLLGLREPDIYGHDTFEDLIAQVRAHAESIGIEVDFYQSNHEGDLVDALQRARGVYDGIVINPAAYTHTSIALLDAAKAISLPIVEVHLSDVHTREAFRNVSFIRDACVHTIMGRGIAGYCDAIDFLANH